MQINEQPEKTDTGVELFDWDNFPKQRQMIFDKTKAALESSFPQKYGSVRVELHEPHYTDPEEYSIAEQKSALMGNRFLHRRLRGTLRLFDDKTNVQLDESGPITLMRVPYLTERGTFINNGSEYTHVSQSRLRPGVYTRKKDTGEVESHFNTARGTGRSFRLSLEPESGVFKLNVGQSSLRLYSLLHDIGVPDEQLEKSWGKDLLEKNRAAYDGRVFEKAYARLAKRPDPNKTRAEKVQEIHDALSGAQLDRDVLERTLPNLFKKQAATLPAPPPAQVPVKPEQQAAPTEFTKPEYEMLALMLNEKFHAGLDLNAPASVLVQELIDAMQKILPGVTPEGLAFALSQHKNNFNDYGRTEEAEENESQ